MEKQNILITGNAGMIGSHLSDKLVEIGNYNIIGIDNLSTGSRNNINKEITFIEKDINDNLTEIFDNYKFDYIFHLAAQINLRKSINNFYEDARTNILGSINLIQNSYRTKVKKFIFSSTGGAIYDKDASLPFIEEHINDKGEVIEFTKVNPASFYGLSKKTVEDYLKLVKQLHNLEYVTLRYSNVYGSRQNYLGEAGVIAIFINNILQNKEINIFGSGEQTRDMIYVEDVIEANILALNSGYSGVYNISSNTEYSVNDIAKLLMKKMNKEVKINYLEPIIGEIQRTRLLNSKMSRIKLSNGKRWLPSCDFEEGIDKTIEYFKESK